MSVRAAILGLLAQRPRHGYELHEAFEALVGGRAVWDLKPAQVYTTLQRLEEAGLVVRTAVRRVGGPDQHVFALTEAGRAELDRWYAEGVHSSHQRDEVFLKIVLALGDEAADAEAVIRAQRATLYRDLHELTTHRSEAAHLTQAMLLDKAIMHIEADLRWLEMADARLHEMRRHAVPVLPERRRGRPRAEAGDR
ncbi:MAG: PadR family transcriptional regulator [Coriobacteriia bacterium]|nr:PadR family transcriptional regulator [Coriobacteriia bacterium]